MGMGRLLGGPAVGNGFNPDHDDIRGKTRQGLSKVIHIHIYIYRIMTVDSSAWPLLVCSHMSLARRG